MRMNIAQLTIQEQELKVQPDTSCCKDIVVFLPITVKRKKKVFRQMFFIVFMVQ